MAHSYSYQLPNADKHIVFHLHKLTILIWYILLESYGSKLSYIGFQLTVVQNTAQLVGLYFEQELLPTVDGATALVTLDRIIHFENSSHKQWLTTTKSRTDCVVYLAQQRTDAELIQNVTVCLKMPNSWLQYFVHPLVSTTPSQGIYRGIGTTLVNCCCYKLFWSHSSYLLMSYNH